MCPFRSNSSRWVLLFAYFHTLLTLFTLPSQVIGILVYNSSSNDIKAECYRSICFPPLCECFFCSVQCKIYPRALNKLGKVCITSSSLVMFLVEKISLNRRCHKTTKLNMRFHIFFIQFVIYKVYHCKMLLYVCFVQVLI